MRSCDVLIGLGLTGLFLSTFGTPVLALLISIIKNKITPPNSTSEGTNSIPPVSSFEFLIPAHNEEILIQETLSSILEAGRLIQARMAPTAEMKIAVGLDHCTDGTRNAVSRFAAICPWPVRVIENPISPGKWNTLKSLLEDVDSDWIAFIDSGTIWSRELLMTAWNLFADPRVIAVAPSYQPAGAGLMEKVLWRLESILKRIESMAGGPVTVHGATVFYRRPEICQAVEALSLRITVRTWLNDDVVIPLHLRYTYPRRCIATISGNRGSAAVRDLGVVSSSRIEYQRRRRMVIGNLQWITTLLFRNAGRDLCVTLIASRRAFRLLWSYWVLFVLVGVGIRFAPAARSLGVGVPVLVGVFFLSGWIRRISTAFLSGLEVPFHFKQRKPVLWN